MIAIDPGHGGANLGTCHHGIIEKDLTLAYALDLAALVPGSVLTRDSDRDVPLATRGVPGSTLAIVIHVDASHDPRLRGMTCYVRARGARAAAIASEILATAPAAIYGRPWPTQIPRIPPHPWLAAPLAVLAPHKCPAVLVELGFATNEQDATYLLSDEGRRQVVRNLARAIA